jgi:hypothetical protein
MDQHICEHGFASNLTPRSCLTHEVRHHLHEYVPRSQSRLKEGIPSRDYIRFKVLHVHIHHINATVNRIKHAVCQSIVQCSCIHPFDTFVLWLLSKKQVQNSFHRKWNGCLQCYDIPPEIVGIVVVCSRDRFRANESCSSLVPEDTLATYTSSQCSSVTAKSDYFVPKMSCHKRKRTHARCCVHEGRR